jgi:hypothetical protein
MRKPRAKGGVNNPLAAVISNNTALNGTAVGQAHARLEVYAQDLQDLKKEELRRRQQ